MKHAHHNAERWAAEAEEWTSYAASCAESGGWTVADVHASGLTATEALHRSALYTLLWLLAPEGGDGER